MPASPVFVLTASRSGSTLLRFVLDSHPELACPPETRIGAACRYLTEAFSVLSDPAAEEESFGSEVQLPDEVLGRVRQAVNYGYEAYTARQGAARWCDKSLDTFKYAELLLQIYPDAQFICLFRHCMDVIASGVEACPWGVSRFGFDAHIARNPGNSVAGIGSYWLDCVQAILEFESAHRDRCHRIRYEDLVSDPERTVAALFSFLHVSQVPGITDQCFDIPHDASGPGDEKIWFTTGITTGSVGRGVHVPTRALPPALAASINEALRELEYRTIDDHWNDAGRPMDPRRSESSHRDEADNRRKHKLNSTGDAGDETKQVVQAITDRISLLPTATFDLISTRWPALKDKTVKLVVVDDSGPGDALLVCFAPGQAPRLVTNADGPETQPTAVISASAVAWRALMESRKNLISALTAGELRCINRRDPHRLRSDEVHALGVILGITRLPTAAKAQIC